MNVLQISSYLMKQGSIAPTQPDEFENWLEFTDALTFLASTVTGNVPVYLSSKFFYLYTVIVPKKWLKGEYVADLMNWNFHVSSGWGYGGRINSTRLNIIPPLDHTSTSILDGGEAIFFLRSLYHDGDSYLELNQRISHVLDIHQVEKRGAYCKVDEETGDLVDIVTYQKDEVILCTIERAALDFYLYLTNSVLVRVFDVTRWGGSFVMWHNDLQKANYTDNVNEIYARRGLNPTKDGAKEAGYIRGIQIIRQLQTNRQLAREHSFTGRKNTQYATFIALDWKHGKTQECSCDPDKLGNYFVTSDLPYEISPAFFRPEVILRYKQDTDKYTIDDHSITCRGAWYLRYRTNDPGQIQVYLIDLSHLPYNEQLYWKAFNENPKAGISEAVYKRDFQGSWDLPHDPLKALKQSIKDFPSTNYRGEKLGILRSPKEKQLAKLTYVMSDSTKEWEDQILELAKILGDGLNKTSVRKIAKYLKCDDPQVGSINLLKKCLETKKLETEIIQSIIQPLQTIYALRSTGIAHMGREAPKVNLQQHHRKLVEDCEKSMEQLAELIRSGFLDAS
ncbi:MAG TPA: hypothetical protein VNG51_01710 [Ktedonobacteraceae bacterium]|nr:hypothetical protein [Ktedonobacteraceae bacterium]